MPADTWLLTLSDSLFYGLSDLVVAPLAPNVIPVGLMASGNIFSYTPYGQPRACVDTSAGSVVVEGMAGVSIAGNAFANASVGRATAAAVTASVSSTVNATSAPPACTRVGRSIQRGPRAAPCSSAASHAPQIDLGAALLFSGAQEGRPAASARACDGGWRAGVRADLRTPRPNSRARATRPTLAAPPLVAGVAQFWQGSASISSAEGFVDPLAQAPTVTVLQGGTGGVVTACASLQSGAAVIPGSTAAWTATLYLTFDQSAPGLQQ